MHPTFTPDSPNPQSFPTNYREKSGEAGVGRLGCANPVRRFVARPFRPVGRLPMDNFSSETVYLLCAIAGGTLMVCQFLMSLLGFGDHGHDLGGDGHEVHFE